MTLGLIGPFLAGFLDTGEKLFLGKFLATAVALEHDKTFVLDFLVSGEAMSATGAFTAAADGGPFPRSTRINDLVILATALRAAHKRPQLIVGRRFSSMPNIVASRNQ